MSTQKALAAWVEANLSRHQYNNISVTSKKGLLFQNFKEATPTNLPKKAFHLLIFHSSLDNEKHGSDNDMHTNYTENLFLTDLKQIFVNI